MLFFLSFRNAWRNRTRTLLLLFAVALITALAVMMQAQLSGLRQDVYTLIIRNTIGDAQIIAQKSNKHPFFRFEQAQFECDFPKITCLPTLQTQAWLQQAQTHIPLQIWGRDSMGGEAIKGLVISPHLLAILKLEVGDSIALKRAPNAPQAFFKIAQARQISWVQADNIVLMPLKVAQQFCQVENQISLLSLQFAEALPPNLPAWVRRQGLTLRTWQEVSADILQMFALLQATFTLITIALYTLLGLSILLIFIQNWRERKLEIARLRILGMTVRQVWGMLVAELGFVLGAGYLLGLVFSLPAVLYFSKYPIYLHTDIAKALQSVGFPARLSFGWSWELIGLPLSGWGAIGLGLAFVAFGFAKTSK